MPSSVGPARSSAPAVAQASIDAFPCGDTMAWSVSLAVSRPFALYSKVASVHSFPSTSRIYFRRTNALWIETAKEPTRIVLPALGMAFDVRACADCRSRRIGAGPTDEGIFRLHPRGSKGQLDTSSFHTRAPSSLLENRQPRYRWRFRVRDRGKFSISDASRE